MIKKYCQLEIVKVIRFPLTTFLINQIYRVMAKNKWTGVEVNINEI